MEMVIIFHLSGSLDAQVLRIGTGDPRCFPEDADPAAGELERDGIVVRKTTASA